MYMPENIAVVHSSLNGSRPEAEAKASSSDLMAKLMGDWSLRPQMQVTDPGYVWPPESIAELNVFHLAPGFVVVHTLSPPLETLNAKRIRLQIQQLRPWSIPACKGLEPRPPRIGPVM